MLGAGGCSHSVDRRGRQPFQSPERQPFLVKRTVGGHGNTSYPMLTRTNYGECVVLMKVRFQAQRLWHVVEISSTNKVNDRPAMEAIL